MESDSLMHAQIHPDFELSGLLHSWRHGRVFAEVKVSLMNFGHQSAENQMEHTTRRL